MTMTESSPAGNNIASPETDGAKSSPQSMGSSSRAYSLTKMSSVTRLGNATAPGPSPFLPEGILSPVFGPENPPKDWCDVAFLVPHEALRHEMRAMIVSVNSLQDDCDQWKVNFFARWYIEFFSPLIHDHHENEEEIYFPWVATRGKMPDKLAKDHVALVELLDGIKSTCESVVAKKGIKCNDEIATLKVDVPKFVEEMTEHLNEEEKTIPPLLRANFTIEEEHATVEKILQKEGISGAKAFIPSIITAMHHWAGEEFNSEFLHSIPQPIRGWVNTYFLDNYENVTCALRDAPTMAEEPMLKRAPCFGISFCFPCLCF